MKELIIKKGDKQITVADKEDVTNALNSKVSTNDPRLSDARTPTSHTHTKLVSNGSIPDTATSLEDYTEEGYYTGNSTVAGKITDIPYTGNYSFLIENKHHENSFIQFCYKMPKNNLTEIYYRKKNVNNDITDWRQIANRGDAPASHASSDTTYGVGSASNYGHVKVDSTPTDSSSNAVASGGVKTVLDTKQNEVETQAKVTQFTNKDRITIERLIERMNNPDSKALFLRPTDSDLPYYTFCENIKVGKTNNQGVSLYLDGAEIGTSASSVVLKKIDGTKIGDFTKRGTDPAGWGYSLSCANLGVGIHYLYAEATFPDGSVRKSNILTVFVKDTNNLESYNVWSGTDYNKNTDDFIKGSSIRLTSSNLWSINGEYSLQVQRVDASNYFLDTQHLTDVTVGKTITYSCKVYSPYMNVRILLRGKGSSLVSVTAPASNEVQNISVSAIIPESYDYMCLRFLPAVDNTVCYIDDINCIVS